MMEQRIVKAIDDPLLENLTLSFVNNQTLSVRGFQPVISSTRDEPSKFHGKGDIKLYHLEPTFVFEEPTLRALLSEASNIFMGLQQNTGTIDVTKISLMYRSAIRSCLESLQLEEEKNQDLITVFYSIECIWHLFELLFLSKSAETLVVHHLLDWTYFHFPKSGSFALELMQLGREVDTDPNYWVAVKDLVAKGKIDIARTLLHMHIFAGSVEFKFVDEILSKIQKPLVGGRTSEISEWQLRIQSGSLAAEPELEEIARLITGDKSAWSRLCKSSDCWYEYFPGFLYYTEPNCKVFKLPQYVNSWLSQWLTSHGHAENASIARLNHLDKVVLGVIDGNIEQVLHDIQNMCDDKWFATHLTDLLMHFGQNSSFVKTKDLTSLRNSLVFDFGANLMSRKSFWHFGIDYLEHCPDGPEARKLLLPRVPITSEVEAFKLLSAGKKSKIETEICRIMTQRNLSLNRHGNALQWSIRSGDKLLISSVVDIFLKHYVSTGELLCEDVLGNVGPKMFACPSLVFLVKYYDFQEYYKERAFTQAADLLVSLLDSKVTPPYFWPSLMADTIPLLEFKEPVIPSKETFSILHHIESDLVPFVEKSKKSGSELGSLADGKLDEMVQLVRLACARNLSRCLVIENILGS